MSTAARVILALANVITRNIPESLNGLDTLIPPVFTLSFFISVALVTQKVSPPKVYALSYIPTEEELVEGKLRFEFFVTNYMHNYSNSGKTTDRPLISLKKKAGSSRNPAFIEFVI